MLGPGESVIVGANLRHRVRALQRFRALVVDSPARHRLPGTGRWIRGPIARLLLCRRRSTQARTAAPAGWRPRAESGKAKRAQFRWACEHRLRDALDTLPDSSRRHSLRAADIYDRARARGASHPHAARILGRAWCQVIWRRWQDHDTYNPAKHTALQKPIATAA